MTFNRIIDIRNKLRSIPNNLFISFLIEDLLIILNKVLKQMEDKQIEKLDDL